MSTKRKTLNDLYQRGKTINVEDPDEPDVPVTVYIRKLNDVEMETCFRKANAAKAAVEAGRAERGSEQWLAMAEDVKQLFLDDRDLYVEYLLVDHMAERDPVIEAQVAGEVIRHQNPDGSVDEQETEWMKDGYLQGLRDAWFGGMQERHAADPEDPEAANVLREITRFNDEVRERLEEEHRLQVDALSDLDVDDLRSRVIDRFLETKAATTWAEELRRWQMFFYTRDPVDKRKPHFAERSDVDDADEVVRNQLTAEYEQMVVDITEGKGLPATPASSPQSASLAQEATTSSSGPSDAPG